MKQSKNKVVDKGNNFLFQDRFIEWRMFRTKEMDEYWHKFISENPYLEDSLQEAIVRFDQIRINRTQLSVNDKEALFHAIIKKITARRRMRRLLLRISSAAAILLLGFSSVTLYYLNRERVSSSNLQADSYPIADTIDQKEVQIITGKQKITISNNSDLELTKDSKVVVTDNSKVKSELVLDTVSINKLTVPYGKYVTLTLSDGTKMWVNAGSCVEFPSIFSGKERRIKVCGEAYIEVAKDEDKPFLVDTKKISVQVLGTSFNISAYKGDDSPSVVLLKGKVIVKSGCEEAELVPNERVELSDGMLLKETVDASEYISWTRGVLEFNEATVSEILKRIGRYYNVTFDNSSDISLVPRTFSGKLYLSKSLDSIMLSISKLSSIEYIIEDGIINIIKK